MADTQPLLRDIFAQDFSSLDDPEKFLRAFFAEPLTLTDLKKACAAITKSSVSLGGKTIPSAVAIPGNRKHAPFLIIAQLHGNEPAGLAGILLAMALSQSGKLERDVIGVIGNPLAASQYFSAWSEAPTARQETRDAYRCGLDDDGQLLPDMNRIPVDFAKGDAANPHIKRAQELYHLAEHASGTLDIHTARGDMVCVTDYKREKDLRHSPIRNVLVGLADAISAHASGAAKVQTFKTITSTLPNIESQTGIEAGKHESPQSPQTAASFTLSILSTLGITQLPPLAEEDGVFSRYEVKPRITYNDLAHTSAPAADDQVYMVLPCSEIEAIPKQSDRIIIRGKNGTLKVQTALEHLIKPAGTLCYALHQYNEMEALKKGQVVAVAVPSGVEFTVPGNFSGIFVSKSASLYPLDPAVGPWPVPANKLETTKFCYPCVVSPWKIDF